MNMNRRRPWQVLAGLALVIGVCLGGSGKTGDNPKQPSAGRNPSNGQVTAQQRPLVIGVFQLVEHAVIDQATDGFTEVLGPNTTIKGRHVRIDKQNAHGDNALIDQIAAKFVADNVDLVYVLGTPAAQAIAAKTQDIPIILGGATDPVGSKLVDSWDRPGHNVTGTSDLPPVEAQFAMLKELKPSTRKVGIIFNSGEANSVAVVERARVVTKQQGLTLVERAVTVSADVSQAAASLVGACDALYLSQDNTVHSAMPILLKTARDGSLPVIGYSEDAVDEGALFALSIDYREIGRLSGEMAREVLEGKKPGDMPIRLIDKPSLIINLKTAKELNIRIPDAVLARASKKIEHTQ